MDGWYRKKRKVGLSAFFMSKIIHGGDIYHHFATARAGKNTCIKGRQPTMNTTLIKYISAWIVLPFVAIFNGILRDLAYSNLVGDHIAHQMSSVILAIAISFHVLILNSKIPLHSVRQALIVGLTWLFLTVGFEFLLGFTLNVPVEKMLADYDITKGHLWGLVLASTFLSPILLLHQRFFIAAH